MATAEKKSSKIVKHLTITILTFFTLLFIFTLFISPPLNPTHINININNINNNNHYSQTFLSLSSNTTISNYHHTLTLHPHLAGTPSAVKTTTFVGTHFHTLGFDTRTRDYTVLLSYPTRVFLSDARRIFIDQARDQARTGLLSAYHAYSPSGEVLAPLVWGNYGRDEDYDVLLALGVNVTGTILLVKRGDDVSRGDLVRKAAEKGVAAVLTYVPGPEGPGPYVNGVERGTVMRGVGDPLSPGWGSVLGGGERLSRDDVEVVDRFPRIPSMPVSLETAREILGSLEGPQGPSSWKEDGKLARVCVGPGPSLLNFSYEGEKKMATISDVFAVIKGVEEPDRYVLLGNHRDAWTYGGVDPNSGTAALLDVARRYAHLMSLGWRPRRSIVLCSWDAEEFGMIGSTEWVEENIMNIGSKAVAYLNVDCAVQGPGLFPSATPQLDDLLIDVTKKVKDPDAEGRTVYEEWTTRNKGINIQRLSGVDSDFAPFLQHAGVPSLDLYFGKDFPVYHTAYDSYDWMVTYGDPLFHRHVAAAELWGLLALRLADDPILPFNYSSYAVQLQAYTDILSNLLEGRVSVAPITNSIQHFLLAAKEVQDEAKKLSLNKSLSDITTLKERMLNDRMMLAERGLLDADGILGNKWFKHLVYGPSNKHDTKLPYFPSIANAISQMKTSEDKAVIQHEIWRVARAIQRATDALKGDLF